MRKLLLATVAALGASMGAAAYADAQVVDNTDGQTYPTPGTVTVRLNGRFRFYLEGINQGAGRTSNGGASSNASTSAATIATNTTNSGINKLANYGTTQYARLYPGFDGVAANGLKYGASLEIRAENGGASGGGTYGSVSSNGAKRGELYFRREWGYIGTDKFGTLRLGASDTPTSLYLTGNFENFDDGGLNGDLPDALTSPLAWPFADVGNIYTTSKIVYLSPQFYGVDFGLSFEPTTSNITNASSGCASQPFGTNIAAGAAQAGAGCDNLSSSSTSDVARRRNMYEGLVRYRGTIGPVGLTATAAYDGSGRVNDSGVVGSTTNPKRFKFEDLSVADFGLALTYSGLTVGGNYMFGRYNVPAGGGFGGLVNQGQPNASAFVVGATYAIGPVIFGAHYLRSFSEGDQVTATGRNAFGAATTFSSTVVSGGQRREQGVAAGATYSLAPGVSLYLSTIWMERKQNGFNFITSASNNALNNKISEAVYAVGTSFAW
jgi:predicted porin